MRLNEIFDTKITDRKISKEFNNEKLSNEYFEKKSNNDVNAGNFGYVKKSGDPFTVNKRPHIATDLENDGYFRYIKYVVDNNLAQSNPFFPRVYGLKTFTDKNGRSRYSIKLEKLENFDNVSINELQNLAKQLFKNYDELIQNVKKYRKPNNERDAIYWLFHDEIAVTDNLKNSKLKQAIEIISNLQHKDNKHFNWDLHAGNVMARRVPYGLQLVIIDPFSQRYYPEDTYFEDKYY